MWDSQLEDSCFVFHLKIITAQSLALSFAFTRAASGSLSKLFILSFLDFQVNSALTFVFLLSDYSCVASNIKIS